MSKSSGNERKAPQPEQPTPSNLEAERTVLGHFVMGGAWRTDITAHDFAFEREQTVWHAMKAIIEAGDQIDRLRLIAELGDRKSQNIGSGYFAELGEGWDPRMPIDSYVRKLHDATTKRDLLHHSHILMTHIHSGDRTADELIEMGTAAFAGLQAGRSSRPELNSWPEPLPIGSELPPVAAFDPSLLPDGLRAFVEDVSERMQIPLDGPAACLMVAMGGAIGRRGRIWPKVEDTGWIVIPNLWGGIIAPPGFLKSPTLHAVVAPLYAQEELWRNQYQTDLEEFAAQKEEVDLRLSAWKEQTKAAMKKGPQLVKPGDVPPPRPDTSLRPPTQKRLITTDSTFEELHEVLSQNSAGLLVIRDELTSWWDTLDREGRQGERGFFLSAWNGNTPHTIDRIGRGSIHVPACCLSLLGGITPGKLKTYLVGALDDGPSADGLIQRFQLLVWPDPPRDPWRYVDRVPAKTQSITGMFERIARWDADLPAEFASTAKPRSFSKVGWETWSTPFAPMTCIRR